MKSFLVAAGLISLASAVPRAQVSQPHRRQSPSSYGSTPTVTVKNGTIAGVHQSNYGQDYFLGIPFAQPPVDQLRYRNPRSINASYDGTLQATEYAPMCYGYGGDQTGYPQSEDCLYLNVIRPAGYENQSLPVGVWIHGGGLSQGGTRDRRYNLTFIVQNSVEIGKPMIGVSIAYRLGPWGFLQSQEVSASGNANIGLRDQRLALHWLNENIGAFGGDKDKVTIWGESAGAASVGWHLTAYNGRDDGLFRAGIMQSGNPVAYGSYSTDVEYQPRYAALVEAANCSAAIDTLNCLREVPSETLVNLFNTTDQLTSGWNPIVDGDFIQRWASIQLQEGAFVKVPILDGANTDEGTSFGPRGIDTDEDFQNYATNSSLGTYVPAIFGPEVLQAYPFEPEYFIPPVEQIGNFTYPDAYGAQYRRSAAYAGDVAFHANRRGAVEAWTTHGVPAYSYRFNTIPAGVSALSGVGHFQEVAFVFDNTDGLGYGPDRGNVKPFENKTQNFFDLAEYMSKSWVSFISDLDPNYASSEEAAKIVWPRYSLDEPQNIVWDANVTELAFVEPDTYRSEGIRWILDHALLYRR